jgi:hypothetical protein
MRIWTLTPLLAVISMVLGACTMVDTASARTAPNLEARMSEIQRIAVVAGACLMKGAWWE